MGKKIKVMHLINSFSLAGAEMLAFNIVKYLDKEKFEVTICAISKKNDYIENDIISSLKKEKIKVLNLERKQNTSRIKTINDLRNIIKENNISILHTHCASPDFYGKIAGKFEKIDVYTTIHSREGYSKFHEKVLQYITKKYVAISKTVESYAIKELEISASKIVTINNGIDISKYLNIKKTRKEILADLNIDNNKTIITNVGRVVNDKGQKYLILAAKEVVQKYPNTHFLIVGDISVDPILTEKLKNLITLNKLQSHVTFTGVKENIHEILSASDIFAFSSIREGFALVTLEAMALGLPIIATDVGSIREIITNDSEGYIVEPCNTEQLSKSINHVLENFERAKFIGSKGKQKIINNYSIKNTTILYEEMYFKYSLIEEGKKNECQ